MSGCFYLMVEFIMYFNLFIMRSLFFLICSMSCFFGFGQEKLALPKEGYDQLMTRITQQLKLSDSEIQRGISGTIILDFRVNENGKIDSADIVEDLGDQIALRLIRILKVSGDWIPAIKNNKEVSSWVRMPYSVISSKEVNESEDHVATPEKGMKAFNENFSNTFEYPKEALNAGVKGTFNLRFTVDTKGVISNVAFENDPGYKVLENAKRALLRSGKWTPAKEKGVYVVSEVVYPLSLDFKSYRGHL
ncbi:TonB family protein [Sphingobacterium siyangense]|uniref:TonB family protein n=1 Tax=Sphingobacterium siyangense TaxID=459529 RepID=UPI0031F8FCC4